MPRQRLNDKKSFTNRSTRMRQFSTYNKHRGEALVRTSRPTIEVFYSVLPDTMPFLIMDRNHILALAIYPGGASKRQLQVHSNLTSVSVSYIATSHLQTACLLNSFLRTFPR